MSQMEGAKAEIGGYIFTVFKLDPLEAQSTLIDLIDMVGPALAEVGAGVSAGDGVESLLDAKLDGGAVGGGLALMFRGLAKDKARLRATQITLMEVTRISGGPDGGSLESTKLVDVYKEIFRRDLSLLYRWFWFAIKVQFSDFTKGVPEGMRAKLSTLLAGITSTSPNTSGADGS